MQIRSDEYGEYINHADFERLVPLLPEGEEGAAGTAVQSYNRDIIGELAYGVRRCDGMHDALLVGLQYAYYR